MNKTQKYLRFDTKTFCELVYKRYPNRKLFAERSGLSPMTVSRLYNGVYDRPKSETLHKAASALGVTPDYLLIDPDDITPKKPPNHDYNFCPNCGFELVERGAHNEEI